jgi:thiol-disulfide isomerase/thioredoxin
VSVRAGGLSTAPLLLGAALGFLAGGLWFLTRPQAAAPAAAPPTPSSPASGTAPPLPTRLAPAVIGEPAPDFTLQAAGGETVRLADLRGRPLAINFWATWCEPCRAEMPALQRAADRYADQGFTVLAVNFDEAEADVLAFGEALGLTMPLLLDPGGAVQRLYRVIGYPTTYFVDDDGRLAAQHIGVLDDRLLETYLEQIGVRTP